MDIQLQFLTILTLSLIFPLSFAIVAHPLTIPIHRNSSSRLVWKLRLLEIHPWLARVAFMAEDELAEIVPNMNTEPLNFITRDFGRFVPQIPTQVPLRLAVALKRRGKCTFRPPGWLSVDNLTQVLEAERESQSTFQTLPFSYVEIARLLFDQLLQSAISW